MSKITQSAKGEDCTVRVVGICNSNPETTVFAHLNGAGMGMKHKDLHGAYACSRCHSFLDGEYAYYKVDRKERDLIHLQAMVRTQIILIRKGLVTYE